jgi:outer membrane murein-binding lipoprotein Lpp
MRKLMMAVAVVGLGFVAGCQQRSNVQEKTADVAEAQQKVDQERQELGQELTEVRQDEREDLMEAKQELSEEQRELADAQHKGDTEAMANDTMDDQAIGGAGDTNDNDKDPTVRSAEQKVTGRVQRAASNMLVITVPDQNNREMRFQSDADTQVKKNDKTAQLTDLKAGDEVRASYDMDENGNMILNSIEVKQKNDKNLMK